MSPTPAKRRRIESPAALRKPFKSPLKHTPQIERRPVRTQSHLSQVETPPSSSPTRGAINHGSDILEVSKTPGAAEIRQGEEQSGEGLTQLNSLSISDLQAKARSLESQLRLCRNDIDTLKQASAIESAGKDDKLISLKKKWREMSKAAAEEVFASSRDRVNRMGGVGAWREREREQRSFAESWDEQERAVIDDNDDTDCEKHKSQEVDEEEDQEDEQDGESFTMAMMLRALNIDPEVLRYDTVNEQWMD